MFIPILPGIPGTWYDIFLQSILILIVPPWYLVQGVSHHNKNIQYGGIIMLYIYIVNNTTIYYIIPTLYYCSVVVVWMLLYHLVQVLYEYYTTRYIPGTWYDTYNMTRRVKHFSSPNAMCQRQHIIFSVHLLVYKYVVNTNHWSEQINLPASRKT